MAGTGKSTIARTIADSFHLSGHLGASFFFKTGAADRGGIAKFFTTIASQLARNSKEFASSLHAILQADPRLVDKGPEIQYRELIQRPLSLCSNNLWRHSLAIVIDALDECQESQSIKLIIDLFCRARVATTRLRVLITSRPELPIRFGFNSNTGVYENLILHEVDQSVVKQDIRTFLASELILIRREFNTTVGPYRQLPEDWPKDIEVLTDMAVPVFILAATICRFLRDRRMGSPTERLNTLLEHRTLVREDILYGTYLSVLRPIHFGTTSPSPWTAGLDDFRRVIGSIVLLASPQSKRTLGHLMNIPLHVIDTQLDALHSVLSVPDDADSPVRLFHLSFRGFLLDPANEENDFRVDKLATSRQLFADCLRVMSGSLKTDICKLDRPGISIGEVSSERIAQHISPQLQYACLYWVHHLEEAGCIFNALPRIRELMKSHFLHWAEVMSLLGRYGEALSALRTVRSLLTV